MSAYSDRELLELAAKAAGLCNPSGDDDIWWDREKRIDVQWNPLTDDGDALRLAVKCGIYFMVVLEQAHVSARIRNGIRSYWCEKITTDEYAATRRAIVRAAAAIGERMP